MSGLSTLVEARSTLVCCGPGGAGKTTVAASLALAAARRRRRVVVVTVDPARRLGDALGLDGLSDEPSRVGVDVPGELWAAMLDTRSTFDTLVARYAPGPEQAQAILTNPFYRNIAGSLSGTQEYMAMEKLFDLHDQERFDLVVVDTPPTRNALDFVDAPGRLTRFLDNPLLRLLMAPARTSLRAANVATQALLRAISRVIGSAVVADAIAFVRAFEGMENGFRDRADRVRRLLHDEQSAFVLVAPPQPGATRETATLARTLTDAGLHLGGLVINRVHPQFGALADGQPATGDGQFGPLRIDGPEPLRRLYANLADLTAVAARERHQLEPLRELVAPAPTVLVPMLESDVHDLEGLDAIAGYVAGN